MFFIWDWDYSFFLITVSICSLSVVKNPVYGLLAFVVCVLGFSLLFTNRLHCDLFSLIVILIYVGAISVTFLFIVMMLNIKILEAAKLHIGYLVGNILYILIFCKEIFEFMRKTTISIFDNKNNNKNYFNEDKLYSTFVSPKQVSAILYGYEFIFIILSTIILFCSMLGSIILIFFPIIQTKKQSMVYQMLLQCIYIFKKKGNICIF